MRDGIFRRSVDEFKRRIKPKPIFGRKDMEIILKLKAKSKLRKGSVVSVMNRLESAYTYTLSESPGKNLAFKPFYTPQQMLRMGVFEGKYINDCVLEFPEDWYLSRGRLLKTLSPEAPNPRLNRFGLKSRLSLNEWKARRWVPCTLTRLGRAVCKKHGVHPKSVRDPDQTRGWFLWFCRYWLGRRIPIIDEIQIARWRSFKRHEAQVRIKCHRRIGCNARQRQALLQWSRNAFV